MHRIAPLPPPPPPPSSHPSSNARRSHRRRERAEVNFNQGVSGQLLDYSGKESGSFRGTSGFEFPRISSPIYHRRSFPLSRKKWGTFEKGNSVYSTIFLKRTSIPVDECLALLLSLIQLPPPRTVTPTIHQQRLPSSVGGGRRL